MSQKSISILFRDFFIYIQIATIFATGLINTPIYIAITLINLLTMYMTNSTTFLITFRIDKNTIWIYLFVIQRIISLVLSLVGFGNMQIITFAEQARFCFCMFILRYLLIESKKIPERFVKAYILTLIIVNFNTIIALLQNPQLSRDLASGMMIGAVTNTSGILIAGYGYVYGLIFIITAILINYSKNRKIEKSSLMFLLLVSSIIVIIIASYTIALILTVITSVIGIIYNEKNKGIVLLLFIVVTVFSLLFRYELAQQIRDIAYKVENLLYKERFLEIADFLAKSDIESSNLFSRFWRYSLSFDTFKQQPLVGIGAYYNNSSLIGFHSTLLDDLARYGIFSLFFWIMIIKWNIFIYRNLPKKVQTYAILSTLAFFSLSIINTTHFAAVVSAMNIIAPMVLGINIKQTIRNHTIWR